MQPHDQTSPRCPRLWRGLLCLAALSASAALAGAAVQFMASVPGAYALRVWPDRIVLRYEVPEAVSVTMHLPRPVQWVRVDADALPAADVSWDATSSAARVRLPAGAHTAHIAWGGQYRRPPPALRVPVRLRGKQIGSLACQFELEKLTASGTVAAPMGLYEVQMRPAPGQTLAGTSLALGSTALWQEGRPTARRRVLIQDTAPVSLVIRGYDLATCPVREVVLEQVATPTDPERLPAMPADGIIIEAEEFAAEGLGQVDVSTRHFEAHGGKTVFQNSGDGHWLEYRFTVPRVGAYDLFVRAATTEPSDLRSVMIDGALAPGLGLVRFPGTGGWGYAADEWAALQLTRAAPALKLSAGEHVLRLTGEGSTHLNLDYFVLVPR